LRLTDGRYLWMFGDTFTNITAKGAASEGNPAAECNYFVSQHCSMPTNTFAVWNGTTPDKDTSALKFHIQLDPRSGYPTSALWPPGWAGRGRTPKTPACESCSLWQAPTTLEQTEETCMENGGSVLADKGGCCSTESLHVCRGYCCHSELYFRPISGIASRTDDRVLIMTNMGKHSTVMPNQGRTYATFAVVMTNTSSTPSPTSWEYTADRMPGTHVWPWSLGNETKEFSLALSRAHVPDQPDLVYLLGLQGTSKVLARANLTDLLDYCWDRVQFWSTGEVWKPYTEIGMPTLLPIFNSTMPEAVSLEFDKRLSMWLVPEIDTQSKVIKFRVASQITGPYTTIMVGRLPPDVVRSDLAKWHVKSVRSHPELVSGECHWVLSMVFYWASMDEEPPAPGLHYFPRLVCVRGRTSSTVTEPPAATTTGSSPTSAAAEEEPAEPARKAGCSAKHLRKIENTLACSDMGDGCHTCRQRAQWIVRHNGRTLEVAYGIVAAEFPQGCGAVLQCKAELARKADGGLEEEWEVIPGASDGQLPGPPSSPAFLMAGLLAIPIPFLFVLLAMRRNRQHAWLRHEVPGGAPPNILQPEPAAH